MGEFGWKNLRALNKTHNRGISCQKNGQVGKIGKRRRREHARASVSRPDKRVRGNVRINLRDADGASFGLNELQKRRGNRWKKERDIHLTDIDGPYLTLEGDEAVVSARKVLDSSLTHYMGSKLLRWERIEGEWFITEESFGMEHRRSKA